MVGTIAKGFTSDCQPEPGKCLRAGSWKQYRIIGASLGVIGVNMGVIGSHNGYKVVRTSARRTLAFVVAFSWSWSVAVAGDRIIRSC